MIATERLAQELQKIALARIAEDRLALPSTPAVAARCLSILREPGLDLQALSRSLERDPVLAAQIVRLANSVNFDGPAASYGVGQSLSRLGPAKVRPLLLEATARQAFDSRDRRITQAFRGIWEHSLAVAMLSRDAATVVDGSLDADSAYVSGLLHDVGKPVIATYLLEAEKMLAGGRDNAWLGGAEWMRIVDECHRPVGVALAEKWKLPSEIVHCIRDCSEYDSQNRVSIANVVRFANALAKREGLYVGTVDADEVQALVMIGRSLLGLGEEAVGRISARLAERVRQHAG